MQQDDHSSHDDPQEANQASSRTAKLLTFLQSTARTAAALARTAGLMLLRGIRALRLGRLRSPVLRLTRICGLAFGLGLIGWTVADTCTVRILPGEAGVRQQDLGGGGIEARDHGPGLYLALPLVSSWHRVDMHTRVAVRSFEREGGDGRLLDLRTPEGNAVQVAVAVPWRVRPGEAHHIVAKGSKVVHSTRVESLVDKVVPQVLAGLDSEAWTDPVQRTRAASAALERLREELIPHHVEPLEVLLTGEYFAIPYEKSQQDQQLALQEQRTQDVLARVQASKLKNESVQLQVEERRRQLTRELTRVYDTAHHAAGLEREQQQIVNQTLAQQLEVERQEQMARQAAEREAQRVELEVRQKELRAVALQALEEDIERGLAQRSVELKAAFQEQESAAKEGEGELARQLDLARKGIELQAQTLKSELEAKQRTWRLAQAETARNVRREAVSAAAALLASSELEADALLAEGQRALERATIDREAEMAELLASDGGRVWLAREAARNLRFGRVALDPADPEVPLPMDLAALEQLLLGGKP